ncbi:hypothetical protein VZT92_006631 [Zoarces viviparus]|uniref:Uncharacterized protein n=1 Tax=Zoarces viviparus TaxID=48416 RepID=A0AAW1FQJ3_ZOAVI
MVAERKPPVKKSPSLIAPPYISDRRPLRCTSAAVLLDPEGEPSSAHQITLHRAQALMWLQTPARNHTDQLGPVLWSPRYERIFLNAWYIP